MLYSGKIHIKMMSNFFFSLQSTIAYLGFHQGQSPQQGYFILNSFY